MHQVRLFGRTHVAYTIPIVDITMEFAASCSRMCKSQDTDGRLQHNLANNYLLLLLLWLLLQLATATLLAMETATASMGRPGTASFFYKLLFIISDSFFQGGTEPGTAATITSFPATRKPLGDRNTIRCMYVHISASLSCCIQRKSSNRAGSL